MGWSNLNEVRIPGLTKNRGGLKLSKLVKQSLLPRQDQFELIPSRSNNFKSVLGLPRRP